MERFWDCARECVLSPAPTLCLHSPSSQQCAGASVCTHHTHTHTPQYIYPHTYYTHTHAHRDIFIARHIYPSASWYIHTCQHIYPPASRPRYTPRCTPDTYIHSEVFMFTYIQCLIHITPSKCPPVTSYKHGHTFIPWGPFTHKTPSYTDTAMHTQSHTWPSYTLRVTVWDSSHPPCIKTIDPCPLS